MKRTGWMLMRKYGGELRPTEYHLFKTKADGDHYYPADARETRGITLEKVSVEITVLPTRRKK
jgi:hypothetical protein